MTTATADKRKQAMDGARKARQMAAQLERAAGVVSDAERKHKQRFAARDLALPLVQNVARRQECLEDFYTFARTYFPRTFAYEFQPTHVKMIDAIREAAIHGSSQSIAGPRGDGKTTCATYAGFWLTLRGDVDFVSLISKNGKQAAEALDDIKNAVTFSDLFAEDFPEVGWVLQQLVTPKSQTVWGLNTQVIWTCETVALPTLPTEHLRRNGWNQNLTSCANGGAFSTRGWRGGLRGMKLRGRRPKLVIGDDCDSRESAGSEVQTHALRDVFERDVAGLGDSRKGCACVYLGTLINTTCFAAYSTDPERRNWHGLRIPLITKFPDRMDLWQEYVDLRKGATEDDPMARKAFEFYQARRVDMDAGYETTNPHRYKHETCPDGLPNELSTIQHYFNWLADWGEASALTELQNNPPESDGPVDDGLTPHRIQHQVSGYPRRVVPPDCNRLTMGVDVGKFLLHWVVVAWRQDGTSYMIDYGTQDVRGTTRGTEEGMEQAITSAIRALCSQKTDEPYARADGELVPLDMTLVDSGWGLTTSAVYAATRDLGSDVAPAKGEGDGSTGDNGRGGGVYRPAQNRTWDILPGDRWKRHTLRKDRVKLFLWDAGYWKDWGINRWLTPVDKPGCRFIWGTFAAPERQRVKDHAQVSYHLCANCYNDVPGRGRIWGERPGMDGDKDHWQDAQAMADVAASVVGVRLGMRLDDKQGDTAAEVKPRGKSKLGFKPLAEIR